MNITSLLCLFSLSKGASVGNTQPGISEPMAWPSCLLLWLMPGCRAQRMVGGNAREQAVLCHAGLGSAQVLDLIVGVRGTSLPDDSRHPRHLPPFPLPSAAVRVQRSEQLHRWDSCSPSCHSPRPSHCRAPTWAPGGQNQSRCNVPAAAAMLPSWYPFLMGGV